LYRNKKIVVIVPAYNEELLIRKTLTTLPTFVDGVFAINDCSTDDTLKEMRSIKKDDKRIVIIDNKTNKGLGYNLKRGLREASKSGYDYMAIMAGDAQMDPSYLDKMLDVAISKDLDYIKANRFMHFDELRAMPKFRKIGNIFVTILTKFATGYYSIFDALNGYAIYSKRAVDEIPWHLVGERYEYENTVLIGLSIIGAKVADYPVPAIYGEETSTINITSTTLRVLKVLFKGFWTRMYYKYVLYNFHPVALSFFSGLFLGIIGFFYGIFILFEKILRHITPTSGTVVLEGLFLLMSFQLLITAVILDVLAEKRD
jgi:glycosyltransferase involved in cell wall biosynthesis